MTHRSGSRILGVKALARVEGEGALHVSIQDGEVVQAHLNIYEPPRFFEAFLRGRSYLEPPDITARICGICPVAYQMSACTAIEDACGVRVGGQLAALRQLLYCGEWIESHTLHIYMLHAPDFLGYDGAIELARDHRAIVERGLKLKKVGNRILEVIGGRAIHPINVRVGGFYRVPSIAELRELVPELTWARQAAIDTVEWVAGFPIPEFDGEWDLISLVDANDYPIIGREIGSLSGRLRIPVDDFSEHFSEEHVEHSTALHGRWNLGEYVVGPLARYSLNSDRMPTVAREVAASVGLGDQCRNPYQSIVVRAVEVLTACDEALRLIDEYEPPASPFIEVAPRAGVGHGASEAPRGLLYHRYELDAQGIILAATIIPPTSQNQRSVEHDLCHVIEANLDLDDDALTRLCEQTIRNYDPCISCATHFLDLRVERL
ncbi:MAG: Ni/Fe hydrogenase subunit alpha [Candidatus Nanopelagicales bacterium]